MNTDVIVAALGAATAIGVPVGCGLIKMYGTLVKQGTQLTYVAGLLNGHLQYHERMAESFITKLKEETEFEE